MKRRWTVVFAGLAAWCSVAGVALAGEVNAGIVIDGGRYVAPPYALLVEESAAEVRVVVGGVVLDQIPVGTPAPPPSDPGPFRAAPGKGLSETGYALYLSTLYAWRARSGGNAAAADAVAAHAKGSALVSAVEREGDVVFLVDAADGGLYLVGTTAPGSMDPPSAEEARRVAADRLDAYRGVLEGDGVILHLPGADAFVPGSRREMLLATLDVMEDAARPAEERRAALLELWEESDVALLWLEVHRPDPALRAALAPKEAP